MTRAALLATALVLASIVASASAAEPEPQDVVLTEDVGVAFSVTSSSPILPGEPINFVLTATNHGDDPVEFLALSSSYFVHEIVSGPADCTMGIIVADGDGFFVYYLTWYLAGALGEPLEPGETRVCHFQMALTSAAPAVYPFTFGLPSYYTDPNPANDRVTLYLRRGDLAPTTLPSNSALAMLLLSLGLMVAAGFGMRGRARRRAT
jgi:hypothetical protein